MTDHDELLDMLEQVNPVPDPEAIYQDLEDARRFRSVVEERRGRMKPTDRSQLAPQPGFTPRGWLVAAAAFAVVVLIGVAGLLLTRTGTDDFGPIAADSVPPSEDQPQAVAPETTTTSPPASTTAPSPTTSSTTTSSTIASTTTSSTTTSTTIGSTTSTPPPQTTSLLGTPTVPPPGVAAEVPWLMGDGPGLCSDYWDYSGPPVIEPDTVGYTGGEGPFFCVLGFDADQPAAITVTADGMPTYTYTLDPVVDRVSESPDFAFVWRSFPGDPLGEHVAEATQGTSTATVTFDVIAPQDSGVIVEPRRGSPGDLVDIYVFGHEPSTDVTVHLYHQPGPEDDATYVTSAVVAVDAAGWGHLHIDTGTADPLGTYQVRTEPESDMWVWAIPPYSQSVLELVP